jgi:hypothetical protein
MYNLNLDCSYENNVSYQKKLLEAFFITEVDDLPDKVYELYQQIEENEQVKKLIAKIEWSPDLAFYTLFSYDTFMYMHNFLVQLLTDRPTTSYDYLYSIL